MSVKSIEVKNYKAFNKESKLKLNRLSVLMGSNSSGKSSLIKLLLLLSQTAGTNSQKKHALLTFGKFTDFGEVENIFYKKDIRKKVSLKFEISEPITKRRYENIFLKSLASNLTHILRVHSDILRQLDFYYGEKNSSINSKDIRMISQSILRVGTIDELETILENEFKKLLYILRRKISVLIINEKKEDSVLDKEDVFIYNNYKYQEMLDYLNILKDLLKFNSINSVEIRFIFIKDKIIVKDLSVFNCIVNQIENKDEYKEIFKINLWNENVNKKTFKFSSNVISEKIISKYESLFRKNFSIDFLRPCWKNNVVKLTRHSNVMTESPVSYLLLAYLSSVLDKAISTFNPSKIRHVSPIRAYPKRYYFMDGKDNEINTNTSEHNFLISFLRDSSSSDLEFINEWLKKFGLEISIEVFKEIVHSIKIKQNDIKLNLLDVGFGISQILPVIIQSISSLDDSLIVIEQPEIHIHPKMQSELADFFIQLIKTSNKKFVIETHSEAFLKRLRRRMAEHKVNSEESISPDEVSIHFIEKNDEEKCSEIRNVDISNSGSFEWPKDFMENDLEDTLEFMKYQGN